MVRDVAHASIFFFRGLQFDACGVEAKHAKELDGADSEPFAKCVLNGSHAYTKFFTQVDETDRQSQILS